MQLYEIEQILSEDPASKADLDDREDLIRRQLLAGAHLFLSIATSLHAMQRDSEIQKQSTKRIADALDRLVREDGTANIWMMKG